MSSPTYVEPQMWTLQPADFRATTTSLQYTPRPVEETWHLVDSLITESVVRAEILSSPNVMERLHRL